MKIMSWNILASEWIKQIYYPKINKKTLFNRKARFNKIMKTINEENADIIMLQEVMLLEYNSLKHYLNNKYKISPLNPIKWKYPKDNQTKSQSESGNVTFIKKNILNSIKDDINHQSFEFGIYTEIPNNNISILNIHLDDLSVNTRNKQMKSVESLLYTKPKCIIGGDFNQPYRKNSKIYNLPEFTIHNTNCPTYYIEEKMNIDNIMSRGFDKNISKNEKNNNDKKHENQEQCGIYPTTMEEGFEMYGSDHLPVIIIL
jgi:endonuclease/exonuclease/phosphatase family metal-dependent hydrolase